MTGKPFSLSVKIRLKNDEGKLLYLMRSIDSSWNPGRWDLPGGKIEPGESFNDAIKREVQEETGLMVEPDRLFSAVEDETDSHRLIHLVLDGKIISGDIKLSSEHGSYKWAGLEDLDPKEVCDYILTSYNS